MPFRSLSLAGLLAGLLLAAPIDAKKIKTVRAPVPAAGWGKIITNEDRDRLREWRKAWTEGLSQARGEGFGAAVAGEGALLDPDIGRDAPVIADGQYRCRMVKLGRKTSMGHAFLVMPTVPCRLRDGRFRFLDGIQRPDGRLWSYDPSRLIFLGAIEVGDERASIPYGRDKERDSLGLLERIGPQRWRLALPRPSWESLIDIVDITPAD